MAERLAKSADYRVLRRLVHRETSSRITGQSTKTAMLLDVETTGLDQSDGRDHRARNGQVRLPIRRSYCRDVFSSFNEPSEPIPPDVIALTGITNQMVAGHRIDEVAVSSFAEDAVIVSPTMPDSTANLLSAIGRYFSAKLGGVRRPR